VRIPASSLSFRPWSWPRAAGRNLAGYRSSLSWLRRFRPDVLLGLGGYVAGPPLLAALQLRIPFLLQEQNTVPGRTNRFFSRWAERIALGFPPVRDLFPPGRVVLTGNPVAARARTSAPPAVALEWGLKPETFTILVMGGSRGARFLNQLFIRNRSVLKKGGRELQIIHLAGMDDEDEVRKAYREEGMSAVVFPFLENIGWAYSLADLLVGRGGAATLTEAAFWGLPALIVPYPFATARHQYFNGRYFEEKGAALVFPQVLLRGAEFMNMILALQKDVPRRRAMAEKARSLFIPNAEEKLVALLREVAALSAAPPPGGAD
jgi:UDP-N-acetylglucosamine--N-acetylmuramyl-(pentapeptide) pyrophosphoryl-undecaprenol N-acetylglucosamine transferase